MDLPEKSKQLYQRNLGTYNLNTAHPLQANAQNFFSYRKYVSIHSEDRDIIKYPSSSLFEIELPETLTNIAQVSLVNWCFPVNYNAFSRNNSNVAMTFKISSPYNPFEYGNNDPLQILIFTALFQNVNNNYSIEIEEGFYNPLQMTTELTNKFNEAVTLYLYDYFTKNNYTEELDMYQKQGGYNQFVIVYNSIKQNIWFGNRSDGFTLTNETQAELNRFSVDLLCGLKRELPDYSNWGLPGNLGLTRKNSGSLPCNNIYTTRFYYGDVTPGDNGFWLIPDPNLPSSTTYFFECPNKINLMGESYFYMEIAGMNTIDETSPYNLTAFTTTTNETNGIVNSAFAKIPISATPISQVFDRDSLPYKLYIPPAEKIRRLVIKLRYHNGKLVDFGTFNYSFLLEFDLLSPSQNRTFTIQNYNPSLQF